MELFDLFPKENIFTVKANEKQLVIKEMIQKLEELGKLTNTDRYYAQVIHRESLENTGIGSGFAIPHARTDSVKDLYTVFGICSDPLDYQSYDDEPVNYVMLSLFPTNLSTKYLYLVGMMAR
ncbi:MAG TPA: PTS sugar transporter subunit IIA, partial [Spirochaetota bacterium]|nr:PTS sugar transporter subunit IIA [Spirochaetota bacterium]